MSTAQKQFSLNRAASKSKFLSVPTPPTARTCRPQSGGGPPHSTTLARFISPRAISQHRRCAIFVVRPPNIFSKLRRSGIFLSHEPMSPLTGLDLFADWLTTNMPALTGFPENPWRLAGRPKLCSGTRTPNAGAQAGRASPLPAAIATNAYGFNPTARTE